MYQHYQRQTPRVQEIYIISEPVPQKSKSRRNNSYHHNKVQTNVFQEMQKFEQMRQNYMRECDLFMRQSAARFLSRNNNRHVKVETPELTFKKCCCQQRTRTQVKPNNFYQHTTNNTSRVLHTPVYFPTSHQTKTVTEPTNFSDLLLKHLSQFLTEYTATKSETPKAVNTDTNNLNSLNIREGSSKVPTKFETTGPKVKHNINVSTTDIFNNPILSNVLNYVVGDSTDDITPTHKSVDKNDSKSNQGFLDVLSCLMRDSISNPSANNTTESPAPKTSNTDQIFSTILGYLDKKTNSSNTNKSTESPETVKPASTTSTPSSNQVFSNFLDYLDKKKAVSPNTNKTTDLPTTVEPNPITLDDKAFSNFLDYLNGKNTTYSESSEKNAKTDYLDDWSDIPDLVSDSDTLDHPISDWSSEVSDSSSDGYEYEFKSQPRVETSYIDPRDSSLIYRESKKGVDVEDFDKIQSLRTSFLQNTLNDIENNVNTVDIEANNDELDVLIETDDEC